MMRRLVDTATPLFGFVGLIPLVPKLTSLPSSVQHTLGETIGLIWAGCLIVAYLVDLAGIWLRPRTPKWSYNLELPALGFGGIISTIYASCIFGTVGLVGWTPALWIYGIGAYQLLRFAELWRANRLTRQDRNDQVRGQA